MGARAVTALDSTLLEEVTGSLAGCLATLDLALAVTTDEAARAALEAVGQVIATSHEHLSRVDAMVFAGPPEDAPKGPLVMGQPVDGEECQHLDLTPITTMSSTPQWLCDDCSAIVEVPGE